MIREFPTVWSLRRSVQQNRKVPDSAFLSNGPIPFRTELTSGPLEVAGQRALDYISSRYFEGVRRFL